MVLKALTHTKMDPLELLKLDHMKVEALYLQFKAASDKKRRQHLYDQIQKELTAHASLEESTFYPACEKHEELKEKTDEAYEEHKQMKNLLNELAELTAESSKAQTKMKVLMEDVLHHVREEENTLFPKVRKVMSKTALERLGSQMRAKKEKKNVATKAA